MWHHIASTIVTRCSDAVLTPGQVSKVCREYISRCPIFLDDLECQESKLANSDTCPRPTTLGRGGGVAAARRPHRLALRRRCRGARRGARARLTRPSFGTLHSQCALAENIRPCAHRGPASNMFAPRPTVQRRRRTSPSRRPASSSTAPGSPRCSRTARRRRPRRCGRSAAPTSPRLRPAPHRCTSYMYLIEVPHRCTSLVLWSLREVVRCGWRAVTSSSSAGHRAGTSSTVRETRGAICQ